jgi:hypothetical protein
MKSDTMNQTEMTNHATNLLAKWLGVESDEISEARFDCYGLTVLEVGRESYAIGDDSQAYQACKAHIEDSVWSFKGSFIAEACGLPYELGEVLSGYSSEKCEGANDALLALVKRTCGFDAFACAAIGEDGRGHFLASYDGDEINLGDGLFAYRIG